VPPPVAQAAELRGARSPRQGSGGVAARVVEGPPVGSATPLGH